MARPSKPTPQRPDLDRLIEQARAWLKRAPASKVRKMYDAQRESWARQDLD